MGQVRVTAVIWPSGRYDPQRVSRRNQMRTHRMLAAPLVLGGGQDLHGLRWALSLTHGTSQFTARAEWALELAPQNGDVGALLGSGLWDHSACALY